MNDNRKSLLDSVIDWFEILSQGLRADLASAIIDEKAGAKAERAMDHEFKGWLNRDPRVTNNSGSPYGDRSAGYITGNGLGSMEIGAVDD